MPRRNAFPKERRHIHLDVGLWDDLIDLYKSQGISPSSVINSLTRFHVKRIKEKANLLLSQQGVPEIVQDELVESEE